MVTFLGRGIVPSVGRPFGSGGVSTGSGGTFGTGDGCAESSWKPSSGTEVGSGAWPEIVFFWLKLGCILLTYLSVISSKFIQKIAQKSAKILL